MFCYLFFYTGRHNFGWAAKELSQALQVSYEKIGWVSFAMLIGYALGQLINGNLADRCSPKHMITAGGLLSAAANIMISFSDSFTMILLLWTFNGYFQSMAWASGSRIIANWWPPRQRGLAYGMYTMAAGTSSIITYLCSILLVQDSWRNLFRIPVLFMAGACIIFFLLVKNKPDQATDTGMAEAPKGNWKQSYLIALANKRFLIVCLSIGFQSMARYGLVFWIPLYFLSKSNTDVWISLLLPIGMATGAISFGFISDRLFRSDSIRSIALGMSLCATVSFALFLFPMHQPFLIGLFVFLAGFFAYGPQANFWPLSPALLGQAHVGTGTGIMNMCAYLFAALGEPLMGKLIDHTGNKGIIFLAVAIIALLSAVTILLTRLVKITLHTETPPIQTLETINS
ncbi:MFS transporter, OPA family, glycerol-3-phosphate transporter [Chitinophaga jiangningensis]|uniref:MFS transporter, OPA family, glycerol-3-phosphate transporter n=2 Tax=Chitinophaga jiangningensis TaxID=1419482 RepID=A0A1M6ZZ50_9BACT|nr:MFS transporter, OPA family, glycerol-3-phosphate transporter [Chitinophaga jiangningensis]